jgi:hypothetical protein
VVHEAAQGWDAGAARCDKRAQGGDQAVMSPSSRPAGRPRDSRPPRAPARRAAVPPAVRAVARFSEGCDYEAAFTVERPEAGLLPAEQWARTMFEQAPLALRWFLILGWTAITCRLRPRHSPDRVLGWQIEQASPDAVVLVVRAWVGLTSRLVIWRDADAVTVATFVRYSGPATPVARAVWAATVPLHERMLPYLLTAALHRGTHDAHGRRPVGPPATARSVPVDRPTQ